jgi:hypothetical protein
VTLDSLSLRGQRALQAAGNHGSLRLQSDSHENEGNSRGLVYFPPPHHHRRSSRRREGRGHRLRHDLVLSRGPRSPTYRLPTDAATTTATTCTAFSPHCAEDRHGPRRSQHETESPKQSDCTLPPEDCEAAAFREKSDLRTYLQSVSNRESNMPLLNLAPRVDFSLCLSIFFRARDVCAFPPFPRCKMTTPLSPVSLKSPRL